MIDVEEYRRRIGSFLPRRRNPKFQRTMLSKKFLLIALTALVIQNILFMSGNVELNPGPSTAGDNIEGLHRSICMCCMKPLKPGERISFDKENCQLDSETLNTIFKRTGYNEDSSENAYLCRYCMRNMQNGKVCHARSSDKSVRCICCDNIKERTKSAFRFNAKKFNFEKDSVRTVFPGYNTYKHSDKVYICRNCSRRLMEASKDCTVTSPSTSAVQQQRLPLRTVTNVIGQKRHMVENSNSDDGEKRRKLDSSQSVDAIVDDEEVCPAQEFVGQRVCTCCHRNSETKRRRNCWRVFKESNYNFDKIIVQRALSVIYRIESRWICAICHDNLRQVEPKMPRHAIAYIKERAGQKFLKAREELPEYVCTCCHRMLFLKGVHILKYDDYDWDESVVKKALAAEFRYKSPYKEDEYICATCRNTLRYGFGRAPKLPAQAVANGLSLPEIPHELKDLNTLERMLIAQRIPFMKIMAAYRYGSSCIVNGPCVNVPASIDKICNILPNLPAQAQIIPMKLKRKVIYKGYHMFSHIRKDVVVTALKWLLRNNPFYKDIELNEMWRDQFMADEVGQLLCQETESDVPMEMADNNEEAFYAKLSNGTRVRMKVSRLSKKSRKGRRKVQDSTDNEQVENSDNELQTFYIIKSDDDTLLMSKAELDELRATMPVECPIDEPDDEVKGQIEIEDGVAVLVIYDNSATAQKIRDAEREEQELREDQAAADRNAEITGQPFSSTLQYKNLEDAIYSVAPGEGNTPQYMLLDKDFEALAFPDLFPDGTGMFQSVPFRESRLTLRRYFQQRVLNIDGRFAKNIEYIAAAQYMTEIKQLQMDTTIRLRMTKGRYYKGEVVNARMLKSPEKVRDMIKDEQAFKCLENIRGSPAYWKHQLYEVLAMIRTLGIPTWFLTLSAADLHWPEIIQAISIQYGPKLSKEEVMNMDWATKSNYLKYNPVQTVRMFEHFTNSFFTEYIKHPDHPLGEITDYVIKVEFQERGSPHAHCVLWAKDSPKIGVASDEEVCNFIDEHISGRLPTDDDELRELVTNLETHAHSAYCRRNRSCRFGFPKAPSPRTLIAREPDADDVNKPYIIKEAHETLAKVHDAMESMENPLESTLDQVLKEADVSEDKYVQCLKVTNHGQNVILQRSPADVYTNGVSHRILRLWRANIDFQFVVDAYSTVMYVIGYMMKSEKALGEVLKRVAQECKNDDVALQMKKIGAAFSGKRVVGLQESVMRLNSMPLIKKSRKVTYVNNSRKENRVSMPKPAYVIAEMDDDDENIFMTSIHDRYAARPDTLRNMCLAEFAVSYNPLSDRGPDPRADKNDDEDQAEAEVNAPELDADGIHPKIIQLKDGRGKMSKRKNLAVLRTHRFNPMKEPENYYMGQLLLYYPWTTEDELGRGFESCKAHYITVADVIESNAQKFGQRTQHVEDALDNLKENGAPEAVWDAVAPAIEEQNARDRAEGFEALRNMEEEDIEENEEMMINKTGSPTRSALSQLLSIEAGKKTIEDDFYRQMFRGLNQKQRHMVQFHRAWCKDQVRKLNMEKEHVKKCKLEPYRVFLSGHGGTGKSYIIKMIQRDTVYFFEKVFYPQEDKERRSPDQPLTLLTAPTGSAAFQISGLTIHLALKINEKTGGLSNENRAALRERLNKLKVMITDEISMVGSPLLHTMHERLCLATGVQHEESFNFGNVSMLAVGDLYQLPPVAAACVYKKPDVKSDSGVSHLGALPWHEFMFHELTESMRQRDMSFAQMLNTIRIKQPVEGSTEDLFLKSCELKISDDHPDYPHEAMHLYAINDAVAERNRKKLDLLEGTQYTSVAKDDRKDQNTYTSHVTLSDNPGKTGNLIGTLHLKVGARVMLTKNMDVADGLTNGAMGTVSRIVLKENSTTEMLCVLVKFDGRIGAETAKVSKYRHLARGAVPIYRVQETFGVGKKNSAFNASRTQFPLFLSWAVTIHKCQGMTLDEIVVDMSQNKGKYNAGQAYVAFSRVRTKEKLHIINYDREKIKVDKEVSKEMERLRKNPVPEIPPPLIRTLHHDYLSVAHLNIQGLRNCMVDVACDDDLRKSDVICLVETHLKRNNPLTPSMLGLDDTKAIFRVERENMAGGGLMIAIDKRLNPQHVDTSHFKEETLCMKIYAPEETILMCAYCRPSYSGQLFMENIAGILDQFKDTPMVIVGDFNEDLLKSETRPISNRFQSRGFRQHVEVPTRDSGTLLDHVYTQHMDVFSVDVVDCYYSDHDTVYSFFEKK